MKEKKRNNLNSTRSPYKVTRPSLNVSKTRAGGPGYLLRRHETQMRLVTRTSRPGRDRDGLATPFTSTL
jgi:hypothetical protein